MNEYDSEIHAEICSKIQDGALLIPTLQSNSKYPPTFVFYKWLHESKEASEIYARARELQQDYEADNIIKIADEAEDANIARLRIETRKWRASKLHSKKYGDRQAVDVNANISIAQLVEASMLPREEK